MRAPKHPREDSHDGLTHRNDTSNRGGPPRDDHECHRSSSSRDFDNDGYVQVELAEIREKVKCPICLGILRNTRAVKECLHRFCQECIAKYMLLRSNECPACHAHCGSNSLRADPRYDALIKAFYPDFGNSKMVSSFRLLSHEAATWSEPLDMSTIPSVDSQNQLEWTTNAITQTSSVGVKPNSPFPPKTKKTEDHSSPGTVSKSSRNTPTEGASKKRSTALPTVKKQKGERSAMTKCGRLVLALALLPTTELGCGTAVAQSPSTDVMGVRVGIDDIFNKEEMFDAQIFDSADQDTVQAIDMTTISDTTIATNSGQEIINSVSITASDIPTNDHDHPQRMSNRRQDDQPAISDSLMGSVIPSDTRSPPPLTATDYAPPSADSAAGNEPVETVLAGSAIAKGFVMTTINPSYRTSAAISELGAITSSVSPPVQDVALHSTPEEDGAIEAPPAIPNDPVKGGKKRKLLLLESPAPKKATRRQPARKLGVRISKPSSPDDSARRTLITRVSGSEMVPVTSPSTTIPLVKAVSSDSTTIVPPTAEETNRKLALAEEDLSAHPVDTTQTAHLDLDVLQIAPLDPPIPEEIAADPIDIEEYPSASKRILVPENEPLEGPSSIELPLMPSVSLPPIPEMSSSMPGVSTSMSRASSSSAVDPDFTPMFELEEAQFEGISLDRPLYKQLVAEQPQDLLSSFSSVPSHVVKAKWKEFLDLMKPGYGKLIVNPDREHRAKVLFQEICSGNPSYMPSDELQVASDEFAIDFVEAVDTIRSNIHQLPFLLLNEQPSIATKEALYERRKDASLFFKNYKDLDHEVRELQAEEAELEANLKAIRDKLAHRLDERTKFCMAARRKLNKSRDIAKEYEDRLRKAAVLEHRRLEVTEQTLNLEIELRLFVQKAEKLLAKAKW